MADIPQTRFNSPWTVANIEAELNGVKAARGTGTLSEALAAKEDAAAYAIDKAAQDEAIAAKASLIDLLGTGVNLTGSATNKLDFNGDPDGQTAGGDDKWKQGRATTPGVYNIGLSVMQNHSLHAPRTDAAAKMIVMYLNSTNNIMQIFLPLVTGSPIYVRQIRYVSQVFDNWYLLSSTQV